jgi:predicted outer membrane protein
MSRAIPSIVVAVAALSVVAGCASQQPSPPTQSAARRVPPPRAVAGPALTSAQYVASASSIELFIIGSSELALQRSNSPRTREFAQMMITAHKGTSAQLSFEGRRLNLLPSATLSPRHQAMLNELQTSRDFDVLYRRDQLTVHKEAEALHAAYAARGSSPTLRPVAAVILPIIQRHLRMLQYL